MVDSTVIRAHHCAAGARGGLKNQALGRSRGGFSTKIHARTNAEGLPIALLLTPGEAHDSTAFTDLMAEHDADPEVMLADKGYDSDAIRDEVRAPRRHAGDPNQEEPAHSAHVNRTLYATRNRIERFFNRLKNSRRVATRSYRKQLSRLRQAGYDQTVGQLCLCNLVAIQF